MDSLRLSMPLVDIIVSSFSVSVVNLLVRIDISLYIMKQFCISFVLLFEKIIILLKRSRLCIETRSWPCVVPVAGSVKCNYGPTRYD